MRVLLCYIGVCMFGFSLAVGIVPAQDETEAPKVENVLQAVGDAVERRRGDHGAAKG